MKITMSNNENTSEEGWWMVHRMAEFLSAMVLSSLTRLEAEWESRPEVGSSRNSS
jgi:hypothetical protein